MLNNLGIKTRYLRPQTKSQKSKNNFGMTTATSKGFAASISRKGSPSRDNSINLLNADVSAFLT